MTIQFSALTLLSAVTFGLPGLLAPAAAETLPSETLSSEAALEQSAAALNLEVLDLSERYGDSQSVVGEAPPSDADGMAQVTSVSQLSDVRPTDWAFEALQNLVSRYGCIAGYPDGTFRGGTAMSRYEFAAGLNACLNNITANLDQIQLNQQDLATLNRLQEQFASDLEELRGRTDSLEARTAELEANQFSTTTKLQGEVAFLLADAFNETESDAQTVFQDRVRLQLFTSFTGRDRLITRFTTSNIGNAFADELGTNEGRFAFDVPPIGNNDIRLDRLHYGFPATDDLEVLVMASLAAHHFYTDTLNPGFEVGGGANGSLSQFAERNPIYRLGIGGTGVGFTYDAADFLEISAGYIGFGDPQDPSSGSGLFNGGYSALGQLTFRPIDDLSFAFTYVNSHRPSDIGLLFGATGTPLGNLSPSSGLPSEVTSAPVTSNTYAAQVYYRVTPGFDIRGFAGFNDSRLIGLGDARQLTYGVILGFPDLLGEGNLGGLVFGAEPYLRDLDVPGDPDFTDDVPFHVDAFFKYQLTDNISITPGVIVLTAPQQDSDNDAAVVAALRTVFRF